MAVIWQKIKRYRIWLVLILAVLAAVKGAAALHGGKEQPAAVSTIAVERGDIAAVVSATGTINPVNMVDISSKISGLIEEVKTAENEQVKAGQVLIILDDKHLQAQVTQARARLQNSAAVYERTRKLYGIAAVADQQLDAARTDYSVAQAAYDDAVSQLGDTVIRSPIDGVVIGKPIPAGQAVAPGISSPMVLMTVADMSKMQIQTQVDESDIGRVAVGQKVSFTVDAYPGQTFSGVVSNVSQKATILQNVVYYNVWVDVDDGRLLRPAMTARVSIRTGESQNALLVPLSAIKNLNGQQVVSVSRNGRTENVPVVTGLTNDDKAEIVSGLQDGDRVVPLQAKAQDQAGKGSASGMGMLRGLGGRQGG